MYLVNLVVPEGLLATASLSFQTMLKKQLSKEFQITKNKMINKLVQNHNEERVAVSEGFHISGQSEILAAK